MNAAAVTAPVWTSTSTRRVAKCPPRLAVGQRRADGPEELRHRRAPLPGPGGEPHACPARLGQVGVEPRRRLKRLARELRLSLFELPAPEDRGREREVGDPPDLDLLGVPEDLVDLRARDDRVALFLRGEPGEPVAPNLAAEGDLGRLARG